jgi:hypothetical protein
MPAIWIRLFCLPPWVLPTRFFHALLVKMIDLQLEIKMYVDPERRKNPVVEAKVERINEIKNNIEEALKTMRSTDRIKMDFLDQAVE